MSRARTPALVASIIGFAGTAAYVAIIMSQGDATWMWVPWALLMGAASVAATVASRLDNASIARPALVFSTIVFAILGVLGAFTIGIVFLVAAVLSGVAVARSGRTTE